MVTCMFPIMANMQPDARETRTKKANAGRERERMAAGNEGECRENALGNNAHPKMKNSLRLSDDHLKHSFFSALCSGEGADNVRSAIRAGSRGIPFAAIGGFASLRGADVLMHKKCFDLYLIENKSRRNARGGQGERSEMSNRAKT